MAEGKYSYSLRKKWSTFQLSKITMVFTLALGFSMLLALRFFPPPETFVMYQSDGLASSRRKAIESDGLGKRGEQWVEVISWKPRAFIYHNFLSKEECLYLISLAKPHMVKSTVVDSKTGKSVDSRVRTSSGMFLRKGQDKIISTIEKRIADFTFVPIEYGEGLQVLHYEVGQKYDAHYDYFVDELNIKQGGQRMATLLMYLSDVEEGGETVFPAAKGNFSSHGGMNCLNVVKEDFL